MFIKYLRLLSNLQNNRLNLCFVCKIFKSLFKITKTQLFIKQVPDSKSFLPEIKLFLNSMKMIRFIIIRIEREVWKLKFVEITQFQHFKAMTILNFKAFESSQSKSFFEMLISQDLKYIYICDNSHNVKIYDLCNLKIIKHLYHQLYRIKKLILIHVHHWFYQQAITGVYFCGL